MKNLLWLLLALTTPLVRAQPNLLPPDDPRLYQMYFNFHDSLNAAVQSRKIQDTVRGGQMEKSAARLLKLRDDEFTRVSAIAHTFVVDIARWQQDLKTQVDQVRALKKEPDAIVLKQFDDRKQLLFTTALAQLSAALSPAGWSGLRSYINNVFRLNVRSVPVALQPIPVTPPGTTAGLKLDRAQQ